MGALTPLGGMAGGGADVETVPIGFLMVPKLRANSEPPDPVGPAEVGGGGRGMLGGPLLITMFPDGLTG